MEPSDLTPKLARDAKRTADHKHKWKLGDKNAFVVGMEKHPRPYNGPHHPRYTDKLPPNQQPRHVATASPTARGATIGKSPVVSLDPDLLVAPYSSSNSSAESIQHASRAPEPDAGIAYSFDAARGPSDGSDVLGQAMSKAVARFEDKKTTKLVREEYDVVKAEDDAADEAIEVEEDFELVGKFEM